MSVEYAPAGPTGAYTPVARTLHWITAVMVLGLIPAGLLMANMPDGPTKDTIYHLHRSTGAVLIPILLFRLFYRLTHPPAPLPSDIPPLQQFAAHATHWLLYGLLIAQAFIGWIATSAYRAPVMVFWLFELPPIWKEDRVFSEFALSVHRFIGITLAFLVAAHIGAALYHHFVRKDDVLLRMTRG